MPNREIVLTDLTKQPDLQKLRAYLKELYTLSDPRYAILPFAAVLVMDVNVSNIYFVLLTGNVTGIVIKNPAPGKTIQIIFLQDGTGNRTLAGWPATVFFSGATFTITATANKYSGITLTYVNGNWIETGRSLNVS